MDSDSQEWEAVSQRTMDWILNERVTNGVKRHMIELRVVERHGRQQARHLADREGVVQECLRKFSVSSNMLMVLSSLFEIGRSSRHACELQNSPGTFLVLPLYSKKSGRTDIRIFDP